MNAATWHSGGNSNRWKSCHLNDIEGKQVKWNVALRRHFPSRWKRRRNFVFVFFCGRNAELPRCHAAHKEKKREIPAENRRNRPPVFTRLSLFSIRQQSARSRWNSPQVPPVGLMQMKSADFTFFNVNFIEREIGASTNGSLPPLMSSSWIFNERPLPPAAGFTGRPPGSLFKDFPQFPFFSFSSRPRSISSDYFFSSNYANSRRMGGSDWPPSVTWLCPQLGTRRLAAFAFEFLNEIWSTDSAPSTRHSVQVSLNLNDLVNFNWI